MSFNFCRATDYNCSHSQPQNNDPKSKLDEQRIPPRDCDDIQFFRRISLLSWTSLQLKMLMRTEEQLKRNLEYRPPCKNALLIGISYKDDSSPHDALVGAPKDVRAMRKILIGRYSLTSHLFLQLNLRRNFRHVRIRSKEHRNHARVEPEC
jgi:hypothetical protein